MEVIAKTSGGCLIQATEQEVKEILNAVNGVKPDSINIGQKIPAIDYGATITKIKSLKENYYFRELIKNGKSICDSLNELQIAVDSASSLQV